MRPIKGISCYVGVVLKTLIKVQCHQILILGGVRTVNRYIMAWHGLNETKQKKYINEKAVIICDILYCGVSAVICNTESNKTLSKIRLCFEY